MTHKAVETEERNSTPIVDWIKDNALILDSSPSQARKDDLLPLKEMVGAARIVGLGEANHGSREFSLIKTRVAKFLIQELGFETGNGNPKELVKNLGYWVTSTQEVLNLVIWMKSFNEQNPNRPVSFFGCDIPIVDERRSDGSLRDKAMAENVLRLLGQGGINPKVVLWAHNAHISNTNTPNFRSLGFYLKDQLGNDYINFGLLFGEGSFLAVNGNSGTLETITVQKAPKGTYEQLFALTQIRSLILDLRETRANTLFESWHKPKLRMRDIGSFFYSDSYAFQEIDLVNKFDGVVWLDKVTPSNSL